MSKGQAPMSSSTILWYFADPMCSWCWGFSPILEKIRSTYDEQLNMALMLGGLRPGVPGETTPQMSAQLRDDILDHWHEVHKMTGQSFSFEGAMPKGFVYDTEPASRAVVSLAQLNADKIFAYFKSIQAAFYVEQIDVTDVENLTELASQQGVASDLFLEQFNSDMVKKITQQHFHGARQAGVTGFPSLIIQEGADFEFIAKGYRPFEEIKSLIDSWLAQHHK